MIVALSDEVIGTLDLEKLVALSVYFSQTSLDNKIDSALKTIVRIIWDIWNIAEITFVLSMVVILLKYQMKWFTLVKGQWIHVHRKFAFHWIMFYVSSKFWDPVHVQFP